MNQQQSLTIKSTRFLLTLTSSLIAGGKGGDSHVENAGHMYVIPFFLDESMLTKNIHHQALVLI